MQINTNQQKYINHNRYKQYILADKGYYSQNNINYLNLNGYIPIIAVNNRNTKDSNKIKFMPNKYKQLYKKRIIVENYILYE
jgi:hypothetical protein